MGVVLHEGTQTQQTMQRPGRLVAMAGTELGQPDGQIPITLDALFEDLHVAGTIHGLDGIDPVFGGRGEHGVLE